MSKKCPICDNLQPSLIRNKLKGNVTIDVFECTVCDLHFLNTWDNIEAVKALYEGDKYIFTHNVSEKSPQKLKFNEYENRFESIKPFLGKDKTLLEVGCGDGTFLKMVKPLLQEAEGVELSPPQVELLRKQGFTCYDTMIDEMEAPKKYDIICMYALLEHVPNVQDFLKRLRSYIKPGGHIFIEVPNRKNILVSGFNIEEFNAHYYRPVHLYYFTPVSLGKLLKLHNFQFELSTFQQASITNLFNWLAYKKGQPNAQALTSVVPPLPFSGNSSISAVLERVDDFYRSELNKACEGDLLSAHIRIPS